MRQKIERVNQASMTIWVFYGYASANLIKGIGVKASSIEFCENKYYNEDGQLSPELLRRAYYVVFNLLKNGRGNKAESSTIANTCST